ncbi:MAG: hypothetical protein ABF991_00085 [Liquorilactobacillus hordei]|uniref:hypothetical protein n=1 Tax=Liquorilactobacillus hordei TaxID=468911 RepID=UPI0039E9F53F
MKIFENFKELEESDKILAQELLKEVGEGEWQQDQLYVHDNLSEFTKHELTDGWYMDNNLDKDYNGAPDLMNYIDTESLGRDLSERWDISSHFLSEDDSVVETSCGW